VSAVHSRSDRPSVAHVGVPHPSSVAVDERIGCPEQRQLAESAGGGDLGADTVR